jgi:hypothetical protein
MPQSKFHENFTADSSVPQESCQKVNADIFAMYPNGFNIILVDSSMTLRVEVGAITAGRIKECQSIYWRWPRPW